MADMFTPEKRSAIMARIRSVDTKPEVALRRMIHAMGYRFRLHRTDLPGKPDIVLPKHRLAILVHGCFWHDHNCKRGRRPSTNTEYWNRKLDRNVRRDRKTLRQLREMGWKCVVVWECQLKKEDRLKTRILAHLEAGTK